MPTCENCGAWVSTDYERVNSIGGEVVACPECPDRIPTASEPGGWMHARGSGHRRTEPSESDQEYAADGGDTQ